jgi:GAF domain-containing protein
MTRPSDSYYLKLEERLRALLPAVQRALPPDAQRWYIEFLDAGEYGLAVETATDALESGAAAVGWLNASFLKRSS